MHLEPARPGVTRGAARGKPARWSRAAGVDHHASDYPWAGYGEWSPKPTANVSAQRSSAFCALTMPYRQERQTECAIISSPIISSSATPSIGGVQQPRTCSRRHHGLKANMARWLPGQPYAAKCARHRPRNIVVCWRRLMLSGSAVTVASGQAKHFLGLFVFTVSPVSASNSDPSALYTSNCLTVASSGTGKTSDSQPACGCRRSDS
jgi:hypothetical protein